MSHFSNIKTKIRNLNSLKAALKDLDIDWKDGPAIVRGYQGKTHQADIVVEQNNNYDFGFSWNGSEYDLVADLQYWEQPLTVEGFLRQVTQRYAYNTVVNETANQGFTITEQKEREDGSISLVVQRWSA
ncbi:MAG: DUF1257 domain-containing protein [Cyanobacteria bacterium P01_A01_bin.83]